MYNKPRFHKTNLEVNTSKTGEKIESKLQRVIHNREPIDNSIGARAYNERKDGVIASRDYHTDRFEIAAEASTKVAKIKNEGYTKIAKDKIETEQKARETANKIVNDETTRGKE